jgi:hypothetical protein
LSLGEDDGIGSLITVTRALWSSSAGPKLRPFVFFGSSSADEYWGIRIAFPHEVIAYHYRMEDEYEALGNDIVAVYQRDYDLYDETGA